MAPGLVMAILGLFLIFRTVVKDGRGKTLVDHVTSL
jgi:hypothetical protein